MEEVQPYSDLLSRRRGTAKHRKPAFPGPAQGADLVARAQLDIHHQAATPTAAIQKIVDLCIVLALALAADHLCVIHWDDAGFDLLGSDARTRLYNLAG